jgi:hypothetical protein
MPKKRAVPAAQRAAIEVVRARADESCEAWPRPLNCCIQLDHEVAVSFETERIWDRSRETEHGERANRRDQSLLQGHANTTPDKPFKDPIGRDWRLSDDGPSAGGIVRGGPSSETLHMNGLIG